MFRVVDNSDGSTTVICKETGSIVCVVGDKKKPLLDEKKPTGTPSCSGRPISRIQPLPGSASCSNVPVSAGNSRSLASVRRKVPPHRICDQNIASTSSNAERNLYPPLNELSSKDFSEDCITKEDFLQTLNVVSKDTFEKKPKEELKQEFPYRCISKVEPRPLSIPPEAKLYEGLPICCSLTQKWLKQEAVSARFIIKDPQVTLSGLNKISQYCKTSVDSDNGINLPQLRCREQKVYSLTYRVNKAWKHLGHMYSFNRRERLERLQVLKTGLSRKANDLLKKCTPLSVVVKFMNKSEIERYTKRKKIPNRKIDVQAFYMRKSVGRPFKTSLPKHPGLVNIMESPDNYLDLKSKFDGLINHTAVVPLGSEHKKSLQACYSTSAKLKKKDLFKCKVLLSNVLWDLVQHTDACYVGGTSIKVTDIHLLPLVLWQRPSRSLNVKTFDNRNLTGTKANHASFRPSLMTQHRLMQTSQPKSFSVTNPHVQASLDVESQHSMKSRMARSTKGTSGDPKSSGSQHSIVCIDLTDDDDENATGVNGATDVVNTNDINKFNGSCNSIEINFVSEKIKEQNTIECSRAFKGLKKNGMTVISCTAQPLRSATNTYEENVSATANNSSKQVNGAPERVSGKRKLLPADPGAEGTNNHKKPKITNRVFIASCKCVISVPDMFRYHFHCFGCKSHRSYQESDHAYHSVRKHMQMVHSVSQPGPFLKVQRQNVLQIVLIIAFPGYDV